jgi:hypothetical protein|nr:MAG: hypothetical protein KatS3mg041_0528 [Bacteroidota bacterium]
MKWHWIWPVLLGLFIFTAGIGVGVLLDRFFLFPRFRGGPEFLLLERRNWQKVRQELGLSTEQMRQLEAITDRHAAQMNALRQRFRQELRTLAQAYREEIRPVFTEAQWERLETLYRQRRHRFRDGERRGRNDTLHLPAPGARDTVRQ